MNNNPYPHLKISENFYECLRSVSPEEIKDFFKSYKASRISIIEECPDSDLTKERGKLTMISELESVLLTIRNTKQQTKKTDT